MSNPQNSVPKSYKIAEKIQQLIESAGTTKLHATDIWQKVLKEEFADFEKRLDSMGRPCDSCGTYPPNRDSKGECPRCYAEMLHQYDEVEIDELREKLKEAKEEIKRLEGVIRSDSKSFSYLHKKTVESNVQILNELDEIKKEWVKIKLLLMPQSADDDIVGALDGLHMARQSALSENARLREELEKATLNKNINYVAKLEAENERDQLRKKLDSAQKLNVNLSNQINALNEAAIENGEF